MLFPVNFNLSMVLLVIGTIFAMIKIFEATDSDPSICSKILSRRVSRNLPYIETYKSGLFRIRKTRVNIRTEYHTEWYPVDICCSGYEGSPLSLSGCRPICPMGCENGRCALPGVCQCEENFTTTIVSGILTCAPYCSSGCRGGTCTAPGVCSCNTGEKWSENRNVCHPDCTAVNAGGPDGCGVNGDCKYYNICKCHDGYEENPVNRFPYCIPVCDPSCGPNAICDSPNNCACDVGYKKNSNGLNPFCLPVCDVPCGPNSICFSPNNCVCISGYKRSAEGQHPFCLPVCDVPCSPNSICDSPNNCACTSGYKRSLAGHDPFCLPVCDVPCGPNSYCNYPNSCTCNARYKQNPESQHLSCLPVCDFPCEPNSYCAYPNHCVCNSGYAENSETNYDSRLVTVSFIYPTCKPICIPECSGNSRCVAPDTCDCHDGYESEPNLRSNRPECRPVCDPMCSDNSYCDSPKHCACHLGYENSETEGVCVPICTDGCYNSTCVEPNRCVCWPGHVKTFIDEENGTISENVCGPFCPGGCANGSCDAPGQCTCDPGYVLVDARDSSTTSGEESTTSSFVTIISNDYYSTDSRFYGTDEFGSTVISMYQQLCQPLCEPDCPGVSKCVAPNQCEPVFVDGEDENLENGTARFDYSNQDCGNNGEWNDNRNKCECTYGRIGQDCAPADVCAVFITEDTSDIIRAKSLFLTSNNSTIRGDIDDPYGDNNQTLGWTGPKCKNECRKSVIADGNLMEGLFILKCYLLNSSDETNGVIITRPIVVDDDNNEIVVCFLNTNVPCNSESIVAQTAGGVIGVIFAIAILVGLAIYFVRRRRLKSYYDDGMATSSITMTEPDGEMDLLYNGQEASHL